MPKVCIGDGVYVDFDGHYLVLTTENGIEVENTIYIESAGWRILKFYVEMQLKGVF